jgi:hypothetical protein
MIRDIEPFAVRCTDHTVRAPHVFDDLPDRALPREMVDEVPFLFQIGPVPIAGIREIQSTLRIEPEIVWAVQSLLFIGVCKDRGLSLLADGCHSSVVAFANEKIPMRVKEETVGTARVLSECSQFSVMRPYVDTIPGNIGKKYVPAPISSRAFPKPEAPCEPF